MGHAKIAMDVMSSICWAEIVNKELKGKKVWREKFGDMYPDPIDDDDDVPSRPPTGMSKASRPSTGMSQRSPSSAGSKVNRQQQPRPSFLVGVVDGVKLVECS